MELKLKLKSTSNLNHLLHPILYFSYHKEIGKDTEISIALVNLLYKKWILWHIITMRIQKLTKILRLIRKKDKKLSTLVWYKVVILSFSQNSMISRTIMVMIQFLSNLNIYLNMLFWDSEFQLEIKINSGV